MFVFKLCNVSNNCDGNNISALNGKSLKLTYCKTVEEYKFNISLLR